jgi:preprotein translocase subunit SecG
MIREGYTFLGWADNPQATIATHNADSTFNIFSDTVLYAVWQKTPVAYTVTYKPGLHGSFTNHAEATELVYTVASGEATPSAPQMTGESGWTFAGWNPVLALTVTENVVYTAQWIQNTYTVTYAPGTHGAFTAQVYTGLVYGDATPAFTGTLSGASGYTFAGWSPVAASTVMGDVIYTAQWTANSASGSGGSSQPKPPTATTSPTIIAPPSPTVTPPSVTPPSNTDNGNSLPVWALVNLILSVVGVILAVLLVVCVLLQKQKKQKQKDDPKKTINGQCVEESVEEQKQKKRLTLWLLAAVAMGIAGIIVFLLTEDMSRKMALVDKWTILNVIIFAIEIIAIALHAKTQKSKNKQENKQKIPEAQK